VPIDTSEPGDKTVTRTAISNLGLETTRSCTTDVESSTPEAPTVSSGRNPNNSGIFTLGWNGPSPLQYFGLTYTLQHHDAATETWSTVADGIEELDYAFMGAGEAEGTWVYRVEDSDPSLQETSAWSAPSEPVVIDKTPPAAPTASASRAPDYSGGGGWYKNSVTVNFTANGDPALADASPGSGVEGESLSPPQTFSTSGTHEACGTVADKAGNVSSSGCITVQVDATPPSLEITCPATAAAGEAGVTASVTASDADSGLAQNPSGTVPIDTQRVGPVLTTRTAIDNVGHETTKSCTTDIVSSPPEFGRCIPAGSEIVGGKTVYRGEFKSSSCATVSAGHEGRYEWETGVAKPHFASSGTEHHKVTFETVKRVKVTCTGESSAGQYTSARDVGGVIIKLSGCALSGTSDTCASSGAASGEITTATLEGVLGIDKTGSQPSSDGIGLELHAAGNGTVMALQCGPVPISVRGSMILPVKTNKMLGSLELKGKESQARQVPESFVGGPQAILEASVEHRAFEQAGMTIQTDPANEEAVAISPVA
jgi:hypothetical protein